MNIGNMDWTDWAYITIGCSIAFAGALAIILMQRSQSRLSRSLLGDPKKDPWSIAEYNTAAGGGALFQLRSIASGEHIPLFYRGVLPDFFQIGWLIRGPDGDVHRAVETVTWDRTRGFVIDLGTDRYTMLQVLLERGWGNVEV